MAKINTIMKGEHYFHNHKMYIYVYVFINTVLAIIALNNKSAIAQEITTASGMAATSPKTVANISSEKVALKRFDDLLENAKKNGFSRSFLQAISEVNAFEDPFRSLVLSANVLPESLLMSQDPDKRGMASAILFLGGTREIISKHLDILKDQAQTVIKAYGWESLLFRDEAEVRPWTVKELANTALRARGIQPKDGEITADNMKTYLESTKDTEIPHEWIMRLRRYQAWNVDVEKLKKEVLELKVRDRAVILLSIVGECIDKNWDIPFTVTEGASILKEGLSIPALKTILERDIIADTQLTAYKYMDWRSQGLRRALLYFSAEVLTKADATWLYEAADHKEWISVFYVIVASKLDPVKGIDWLKKAIENDKKQSSRCNLLEALWSIGGEDQNIYIVDHYFAESKPEYSAGGLQEDFIWKLGKMERKKAKFLLKILALDNRFVTLGWSATRAFAQNAAIILGEETNEVKRYFSVEHRMGVYDFEHRPELRDKYPVDTKHVLMQTEAFQNYLQNEIRKRSQKDDEHK
ncbi:MAG: hypothetical protein HZA50_16650 [Planctomycetes bacterium]|nr:hypothetical protein [Planctomycetota bacterium]